VGNIDSTIYFDDYDKTLYLYWKEDGNGLSPQEPTPIWAQKLTNDGMSVYGDKYFILENTLPWEDTLIEAPWLIKRGFYYYLFYSANSYNDARYAVGVARAKHPLGPYHKHDDPILHSNEKWYGPGHCSVVSTPNGTDIMFYHSWKYPDVGEPNNRLMMMDKVYWYDNWPYIKHHTPSFDEENVPVIDEELLSPFF